MIDQPTTTISTDLLSALIDYLESQDTAAANDLVRRLRAAMESTRRERALFHRLRAAQREKGPKPVEI